MWFCWITQPKISCFIRGELCSFQTFFIYGWVTQFYAKLMGWVMCILSTAFSNVSAHHLSNFIPPLPPIFPILFYQSLTEAWSNQIRSPVALRFAVFFSSSAVHYRRGILISLVILNLQNSIFAAMFAYAAIVVMGQIDELKCNC